MVLGTICGVVGLLVVTTLRARRRDAQVLGLLAIFAPVVERARSDPRALLAWYPTVQAARRRFPEAFTAIDQAGTGRFPFGSAQVEAAHARWTTDWLEWERDQDAEYRQKSEAIAAEHDLPADAASGAARTRLETLERERLERYQRRYEEYVRVSRALGELKSSTDGETAVREDQISR